MESKDTEGFVVLLREGSMSHGTAKEVDVGEVVATSKTNKGHNFKRRLNFKRSVIQLDHHESI